MLGDHSPGSARPGPTGGRLRAALAAGVVIALVTVGAGLTAALARAEPAEWSPGATGDDGPSTPTTSTTADRSATTRPRPSTTLYRMDLVVGPDGSFEVRVPEYWVTVPGGADPVQAAAATFPDDPTKSGLLQVLLSTFALPESLLVLVDGQGLGAETVADMAFIERGEVPGVDLATVAAVQEQSAVDTGHAVVGSGRMQTPLGETAWLDSTFELSSVGTIHVLDYATVVGTSVWKFSFWTDRMPQGRATAEEILATFLLRT